MARSPLSAGRTSKNGFDHDLFLGRLKNQASTDVPADDWCPPASILSDATEYLGNGIAIDESDHLINEVLGNFPALLE
jgi:hypothetical protein